TTQSICKRGCTTGGSDDNGSSGSGLDSFGLSSCGCSSMCLLGSFGFSNGCGFASTRFRLLCRSRIRPLCCVDSLRGISSIGPGCRSRIHRSLCSGIGRECKKYQGGDDEKQAKGHENCNQQTLYTSLAASPR